MLRLIQWGVDAIITDRPDLLYNLLHATIPQP
jgi:glycerophosphoryl diester phosphodiesterase